MKITAKQLLKIFIYIYCIFGWLAILSLIWTAFLFGGKEGGVILYFNRNNELIFEFILFNFIFMLICIFMFLEMRKKRVRNNESVSI